MFAASNVLVSRGTATLSSGCRSVTTRSSTTRRSSRRQTNNGGNALMAATSAGAACAMCSSLRMTAACSASTASLHLRQVHNSSISGADNGAARVHNSLSSVYRGQKPHFGNVMSPAVTRRVIPTTYALKRTINTSSHVENTLLPNMGRNYLGAAATLDGAEANHTSGWSIQELAGAVLFAGAASAGSMWLGGPIDRLGGGGGGGGGSGGSGGNNGGGSPVGGKYANSFDSPGKEKGDEEEKIDLGLGVATAPKPYEVSVRALRGGRLSMEDEFVVVNGGRLSAVFDGHGGGGVSQYLRDRLHVIIAEKLQQQEKSHKSNKKFRSEIKRFVFGKGLQGKKVAQSQGEDSTGDADVSSQPRPKYDMCSVGELPISAVVDALKASFDQVDKEILHDDEYEYQGSTAVATLLHEANDGKRTLLSANIGDSRGILSRQGRAIDLTRDHKPNDDKEKARILAMGEKIEWDHYCKVHRVRNLSLSRAIGDRFAKPAVSGEVEIKQFPIHDDKDEFILLASDGLWDVMRSQEVASYVHKRLNAPPKDGADINCKEDMASLTYLRRKNMSRFIANEALRRGSGDNISVVIVWLSEFEPTNPTLS
mmetsp:Transcript_10398/g.18931  ORF Transcript_10398/g.18931 Transcript_10398/m.18931 type:complete len:596 (+) Transcript_10398:308-2095(+)